MWIKCEAKKPGKQNYAKFIFLYCTEVIKRKAKANK